MQKQTYTKEQLEKQNNIMGWAIAFSIPIQAILYRIFGSLPFDIIFSICDRSLLKKQDIWKKGPIAWGWCLISPVYLYKRTKLLNDTMTKFWIHTILYTISCLVSILTLMLILSSELSF